MSRTREQIVNRGYQQMVRAAEKAEGTRIAVDNEAPGDVYRELLGPGVDLEERDRARQEQLGQTEIDAGIGTELGRLYARIEYHGIVEETNKRLQRDGYEPLTDLEDATLAAMAGLSFTANDQDLARQIEKNYKHELSEGRSVEQSISDAVNDAGGIGALGDHSSTDSDANSGGWPTGPEEDGLDNDRERDRDPAGYDSGPPVPGRKPDPPRGDSNNSQAGENDNDSDPASGIGAGAQSDAQAAENNNRVGGSDNDSDPANGIEAGAQSDAQAEENNNQVGVNDNDSDPASGTGAGAQNDKQAEENDNQVGVNDNDSDPASGTGAGAQNDKQAEENDNQGATDKNNADPSETPDTGRGFEGSPEIGPDADNGSRGTPGVTRLTEERLIERFEREIESQAKTSGRGAVAFVAPSTGVEILDDLADLGSLLPNGPLGDELEIFDRLTTAGALDFRTTLEFGRSVSRLDNALNRLFDRDLTDEERQRLADSARTAFREGVQEKTGNSPNPEIGPKADNGSSGTPLGGDQPVEDPADPSQTGENDNDSDPASGIGAGAQNDKQAEENDNQADGSDNDSDPASGIGAGVQNNKQAEENDAQGTDAGSGGGSTAGGSGSDNDSDPASGTGAGAQNDKQAEENDNQADGSDNDSDPASGTGAGAQSDAQAKENNNDDNGPISPDVDVDPGVPDFPDDIGDALISSLPVGSQLALATPNDNTRDGGDVGTGVQGGNDSDPASGTGAGAQNDAQAAENDAQRGDAGRGGDGTAGGSDNDSDSASGTGAGSQSDAQSAENDSQGGGDRGGDGGGDGDGSGKPVVLDLDGDGVELIEKSESDALYDINGDGYLNHMGWAAPDDGFLAHDIGGDGLITQRNEISFVDELPGARTDLEGLVAFDTNADGLLSADDDAWAEFGVWQDLDGDGVTDDGEYRSLDEAGITAIELSSDGVLQTVGTNTIFGTGAYHRSDGTTAELADAAFAYDTNGIEFTDGGEVILHPEEDIAVFLAEEDGATENLAALNVQAAFGGLGDDTFVASTDQSVMLDGRDGADHLTGGEGADLLVGGLDADALLGGAGDALPDVDDADLTNGTVDDDDRVDHLDGGDGIDHPGYWDSAAGVLVDLGAGLVGGDDAEGDTVANFENVRGSNFDDNVAGDNNESVLFGRDGDDVPAGGGGGDTLWGGDGADTFAFKNAGAADTIRDFAGGDTLDLSDFGFSSYAALSSNFSQDGSDTLTLLDANDSTKLIGVNVSDLTESDFLLG